MKIAIAVGIILNAAVLSVIAYQQNQQTAEQGSQVVALLKQLEKPEPEENPLAGKIDKLVALAERGDKREVEAAQEPEENVLVQKIDKLVAVAERAEKRELERAAQRGDQPDPLVELLKKGEKRAIDNAANQAEQIKQILTLLERSEQREVKGVDGGGAVVMWEYGRLSVWKILNTVRFFWSDTSPKQWLNENLTDENRILLANAIGSTRKQIKQESYQTSFDVIGDVVGALGSIGWEIVEYRPAFDDGRYVAGDSADSRQEIIFKRRKTTP